MPRKETLLKKATLQRLNEPSLCVELLPEEELPYWIVPVESIFYITREQLQEWCRLFYPNHKNGCPNGYGKCILLEGEQTQKLVDETKPIWIVYGEFNLQEHMEKMKKAHPKWTEIQLRNLLYWQPTSLAILNRRVMKFLDMVQTHKHGHLICLGESDGVNIWRTARKAGVPLEKIKNMKCCRHLALLCFTKEPDERKI